MNPVSSENPGLNLPPPMPEQAPRMPFPEAPAAAPETQLVAPSLGGSQAAQPVLPVIPDVPQTMPAAPKRVVASTMSNDVPSTADDGDLIEKEWVNKAKQIVEKTRDNPYQQSKELTEFKADYMQKRYNKTIKISE